MDFWIDTSMLTDHFEQQRMERKSHFLRVHAVVKQPASQALIGLKSSAL